MITILGFHLTILCFRLEALMNHHFLFEIFCNIPEKLLRFPSESLFRMRLGKISYCLFLDIISFFSSFENIRDKAAPRWVQYSGKNVIELFILLSKIPYFFIYKRLRIIECCSNFVMSKRIRLLIFFPMDNVR